MLRMLGSVQIQADVSDWGVFHTSLIEGRLMCQLMRSKCLLLRLCLKMVHLERIHVLKVVLLLWEMMLHLWLEGVETDGWVSSMQTAM